MNVSIGNGQGPGAVVAPDHLDVAAVNHGSIPTSFTIPRSRNSVRTNSPTRSSTESFRYHPTSALPGNPNTEADA